MKTLIIFVMLLFTPLSHANDEQIDFIGFTFENDAFFRDDGLYSNGLTVSWGYNELSSLEEDTLPSWLAYLAQKSYLTKDPDKTYSVTYRFAHLLQTAIELSAEELVEEDAPYVGLLAWNGQLGAYDDFVSDQLSLTLGMVGPLAGGELVQSTVHQLIGSKAPQGWDNQIDNEFAFRLQAQRLWRIYNHPLGIGEYDLLTGLNGGVGNLRSDIGAGIGLRWGRALADNFSSASAFPSKKMNSANNSVHGWYLFVNSSAFYVANDIFMDGNTFQDSHSVSLIHQQFGISAGVMVNLYHWKIVYTLFQQSAQYQGQNEASRYGSITVSYNFD
ncbi:MAG: lipid A 3-O-deacylase [Psychromonas sp.]|jgi:lipid A 3-O-deacylase|uniref:lipid A deacylase LpxR family protein n=1 Tax=Psychromonas sp. TaxID=1884585 RepID=UPI0039E47174